MEIREKINLISENLLKMFETTISYLNNAFSYYNNEANKKDEMINDDIIDRLEGKSKKIVF